MLRVAVAPVLIMVVALALWASTGREVFTRWPDAKLEQADVAASDSELDLLADIGLDAEPAGNDLESRFAFGLLPSGGDPRHLASAASAVVLAVATAFVIHLRTRRSHQSTVDHPESSS
jgi:hypothetical protein